MSYKKPFKKCRSQVDLASTSEWEDYTVLDFMRILHIPIDYVNAEGKRTKYGYYIILSSYLNSFEKFYEHFLTLTVYKRIFYNVLIICLL